MAGVDSRRCPVVVAPERKRWRLRIVPETVSHSAGASRKRKLMDSLKWMRLMASQSNTEMSTVLILWHCIFCTSCGTEFVTITYKRDRVSNEKWTAVDYSAVKTLVNSQFCQSTKYSQRKPSNKHRTSSISESSINCGASWESIPWVAMT